MQTILLYGDKNETHIGEILYRTLSRYGGVQYHSFKKIAHAPAGCEVKYLVYELEHAPKVEIDKGIIVFKNKLNSLDKLNIPKGFVSIVSSNNTAALTKLMKSGNVALCCGMSRHDTLSISSFDDNCAVVSLQRPITTLSGKNLEPFDIPVKLSLQIDQYSLLTCVGVLLLSGNKFDKII